MQTFRPLPFPRVLPNHRHRSCRLLRFRSARTRLGASFGPWMAQPSGRRGYRFANPEHRQDRNDGKNLRRKRERYAFRRADVSAHGGGGQGEGAWRRGVRRRSEGDVLPSGRGVSRPRAEQIAGRERYPVRSRVGDQNRGHDDCRPTASRRRAPGPGSIGLRPRSRAGVRTHHHPASVDSHIRAGRG